MNLVLITSIINIVNNPFSYSKTRSFCNSTQRFDDTIKTIDSVRKYIPDSQIVFIDCSFLSPEQESIIKSKVDYFLNYYYNLYVRKNVQSSNKALGEGTLTIKAIEFIITRKLNFSNFFKISGRYWLNENFNFSDFDNDKIMIRYIHNNYNTISTVLYKFPSILMLQQLKQYLENVSYGENDGYEVLFATFINNTFEKERIQNKEKIGINGYISVDGTFVDI